MDNFRSQLTSRTPNQLKLLESKVQKLPKETPLEISAITSKFIDQVNDFQCIGVDLHDKALLVPVIHT